MARHKSSNRQYPSDMFKYNRRERSLFAIVLVLPLLLIINQQVKAEYADVVLNRNSEKEGVRPVVYPHWFHRIRFQCRVCHHELGFEMRVGANNVTMEGIIDGKFCGACHNGEIAWSVDNCDFCHTGKAGLATGITGGHETLGPGNW